MTFEELEKQYFESKGFESVEQAILDIAVGRSKIASAKIVAQYYREIAEQFIDEAWHDDENKTGLFATIKSADRLPSIEGEYHTSEGDLSYHPVDGFFNVSGLFGIMEFQPETWLEPVRVPTTEEIYSNSFTADKTPKDFIKGAEYVLNHLKGNKSC